MLAVGKPRELLPLHLSAKTPLIRKFAVPLTDYPIAFGVVVGFSISKFLLVIRLSLRCAQRFGNCQHGYSSKKGSRPAAIFLAFAGLSSCDVSLSDCRGVLLISTMSALL